MSDRRINVRFAVRHKPGCPWANAGAPQISATPALLGGYEVRVHDLDDGVLAVVCTCGARSFWRGGELLPDPERLQTEREERARLRLALDAPESERDGHDLTSIQHRGPGRPGWDKDLFRRRWREAIERGGLREPITYRAVAPFFEALDGAIGQFDPHYLGELARKHGAE